MTSCLHQHHRALWEPRWPCSRIPIFRSFHFSSGVSLTVVPKHISTTIQLISQTRLHPPTSAPISTSLLGSTACHLLPCSLLLWVSSGLFWTHLLSRHMSAWVTLHSEASLLLLVSRVPIVAQVPQNLLSGPLPQCRAPPRLLSSFPLHGAAMIFSLCAVHTQTFTFDLLQGFFRNTFFHLCTCTPSQSKLHSLIPLFILTPETWSIPSPDGMKCGLLALC